MTKKKIKKKLETLFGENGLFRYYKKTNNILKKYMDLENKYYNIITLWILGTYLHKQFPSYPYLFFNAMKGSGKTRILRIISSLSKNGKLVGSMTEAVLFRTASNRSLCIDEFERNAKGNENLNLLLNSAYKRGMVVERMKKIKTNIGESQEVEEFSVYCPIAIANIWGMSNTLADRCITIILEKSSDKKRTKLIENFENDNEIQTTRGGMINITDEITDDLNYFGDIIDKWNYYNTRSVNCGSSVTSGRSVISGNDIHSLHTSHSFNTLFRHIDRTNLEGRHLELFFPLFILADICGEEILEATLNTAIEIVNRRKEVDREENRDVQLYEYISSVKDTDFIRVDNLVEGFKRFLGVDEKWINNTYMGKALRRLNLVIDGSRDGTKRTVKLNIRKANEKLLMFKPLEDKEKNEDSISAINNTSQDNNSVPVIKMFNRDENDENDECDDR